MSYYIVLHTSCACLYIYLLLAVKPQWHTLKTLALCLEFDFDTKLQYFVRLGAIYPYVFSQMGRLVCKNTYKWGEEMPKDVVHYQAGQFPPEAPLSHAKPFALFALNRYFCRGLSG